MERFQLSKLEYENDSTDTLQMLLLQAERKYAWQIVQSRLQKA